MLFLSRLFKFGLGSRKYREKRKDARYAVGDRFPIKAKVTLYGRDEGGRPRQPTDTGGQDWGGQLLDISSHGISIALPQSAMTTRDELCRLTLTFGDKQLIVPSRIAHFRVNSHFARCGLALQFSNTEAAKSFQQIYQTAIIGSTFMLKSTRKAKFDGAVLHEEVYRGESPALLAIWRKAEYGPITRFEFTVPELGLRGFAGAPFLEYIVGGTGKTNPPLAKPTKPQQEDLRRLFQCIVPNLTKAVPADVRKFLEPFTK